ncbi:hypothetical protein BB558_001175 [Smittium angustum]|uniref:CCDC174 alpha/beta GRSR domain-containing protein n=1 Tax=Smittium angustum TaxID=133377 RepID=A0A2U1JC54_SMIAN|nr:hypothetical protein BB558_001175 [Smittium angustum]
MPKKLTVGVTASLELKAELEKARERSKTGVLQKNRLNTIKREKLGGDSNKNVFERNKRDLEQQESSKEKKTWEYSKMRLADKAVLYEELQSGRIIFKEELNENEKKLLENSNVDFETKSVANILSKGKNGETAEKGELEMGSVLMEEDPWVEYLDEFGRTRTVRKSQVPKVEEFYENELVSESMEVEMERQRWEKEAMLSKSVEDHYNDRNEIRSKGVGFYRLSQDEGTREKQLRELEELRKETLEKRRKKTGLLEKRRMLLDQQRRRLGSHLGETAEHLDAKISELFKSVSQLENN